MAVFSKNAAAEASVVLSPNTSAAMTAKKEVPSSMPLSQVPAETLFSLRHPRGRRKRNAVIKRMPSNEKGAIP